jgi:hypothetical protein
MNKIALIRLLAGLAILAGLAVTYLAIYGESRDLANVSSSSDNTFKHVPLKRGGGKAI